MAPVATTIELMRYSAMRRAQGPLSRQPSVFGTSLPSTWQGACVYGAVQSCKRTVAVHSSLAMTYSRQSASSPDKFVHGNS